MFKRLLILFHILLNCMISYANTSTLAPKSFLDSNDRLELLLSATDIITQSQWVKKGLKNAINNLSDYSFWENNSNLNKDQAQQIAQIFSEFIPIIKSHRMYFSEEKLPTFFLAALFQLSAIERIKLLKLNKIKTIAIDVHNKYLQEDTGNHGDNILALEKSGIPIDLKIALTPYKNEYLSDPLIQDIISDNIILVRSVDGKMAKLFNYINTPSLNIFNALFDDSIPEDIIILGKYYSSCHHRNFEDFLNYQFNDKQVKIVKYHFPANLIYTETENLQAQFSTLNSANINKNPYYKSAKLRTSKINVYLNGTNINPEGLHTKPDIELYFWTDSSKMKNIGNMQKKYNLINSST